MGRNNEDFHSGKGSVGFGEIWMNEEPTSKFAIPHPNKPGDILMNPTGQHNPEHWVPMALDMERKKDERRDEND
jgi:hypothetical protein